MIQVLIISSLYSQTQHLRRILLGQAGHIQLCGTADNSVLGMSLIESLHPDVVIMPVHMTFWNPEDLINYLLPRGICPRFVLLSDGAEAVIEGAAAVKVQQLLPDAMPSDAMLLHAVEGGRTPAKARNGRSPAPGKRICPAQSGGHGAADGPCAGRHGVCAAAVRPAACRQPRMLDFARLPTGSRLFLRLCRAGIVLFRIDCASSSAWKYGYLYLPRSESVHSACRRAGRRAGLELLAGQINALAAQHALGQMTFDISDVPLPLPQWHSQCRQLLELRKQRFFFSPLCLQPKMAFSYRVPVTQQLLHESFRRFR